MNIIKSNMTKLSSSLVLNKYILNLVGVSDLEAISRDLKDASIEGYNENNISYFHHALVAKLFSNQNLPKELLLHYDQNIYSHTVAISGKRDEPIRWKYFQYMALLFTEIYLDKYFSEKNVLKDQLNDFMALHHGRDKNDFSAITDYRLETIITDLNKLAYWNATGSGKTLIMHINILQYRYYLKLHNIETVSYTHLDVYKRQLYSLSKGFLKGKNGGHCFMKTNINLLNLI